MANFKDSVSGKESAKLNITELSASIAAASDNKVFGRVHEFVGKDKIPVRLKSGDQAKFADLTKAVSGSIIRDVERGIVYVPFKKEDYQNMLIGVGSHISKSFVSSAYSEISASFATAFAGVSDNTLCTYVVEEFYTASNGPSGSFVGPVTSSFNTFTPDGLTSSFSGIDRGLGYNMTFDFGGSNFVTNQLIVFPPGGEVNTLRTSIFIPKFQHQFIHNGSNRTNKTLITSSFASVNGIPGVDANATGSPSGSDCGVGTLININGTNANAGTYSQNMFKGRVAGDADSGSLAATYTAKLPTREYVIYPFGTTVASASFHYLTNTGSFASNAARADAITSSADIREVFFVSGANNDNFGRVGGVQTGSAVLGGASGFGGSLAHADPLLQTTASMGFYCLSGSQGATAIIINVITSSRDNEGNNLSGIEMKVPRFTQKVPLS